MDAEKVMYEFPKGNNEKVLIGLREWKEKKYFSARVWYKPKDDAKKYYPSKKGITLSIGLLPQFIGGLCSMAESEGVDVDTTDTAKPTESKEPVAADDAKGT